MFFCKRYLWNDSLTLGIKRSKKIQQENRKLRLTRIHRENYERYNKIT